MRLRKKTDEAGSERTADDWTFVLAPYAWAPGIKGDVGVAGVPASSVEIQFLDDVLPNLKIGGMACH